MAKKKAAAKKKLTASQKGTIVGERLYEMFLQLDADGVYDINEERAEFIASLVRPAVLSIIALAEARER